jgi:Reverse transcriptase (RNA-dependent DNA polymerase)
MVSHGQTDIRTELDSHADTCVVGDDTALITFDFNRPVRVHGYDDQVRRTPCRTVTAVVAYDDPATGEVYMLHFHQAILVPLMTTNLLCPNQLRHIGIRVNDEPKHLLNSATDTHHAITVPPKADPDGHDGMIIPLSLRGVFSGFETRKPTISEYESTPLTHCIDMTDQDNDWEPTDDTSFKEQEDAMLDSSYRIRDHPSHWKPNRFVSTLHSIRPDDARFDHSLFGDLLQQTVQFGGTAQAHVTVAAVQSSKRGVAVSGSELAKRWNIGLERANNTVKATTQRGVRSLLHPHLSRRFRTNDRQLRYRRLTHDIYSDTMESKTVSWFRQNRYAQVFGTNFGWSRAFPMKRKGDAHEALSLLAQRVGVPPHMIMDGSKEQQLGEFRRKAREMGCRVTQSEPYSPWMIAAEGTIRELKKGAGRKAMKSGSPASLWDHCIELESLIRSHTVNDNYELQGQVPETFLTGQTADISALVEHSWYDWIKIWDTQSGFPEPKEVHARYLGPSLDIGPAMCAKVLKQNGQVVYLSTYRSLTQEEIDSPIDQAVRAAFDSAITTKLGSPTTKEMLSYIDSSTLTPEFALYEDDEEGPHTHVLEMNDEEVTPEAYDHYVGAKVMLPVGGDMLTGKVKARSRTKDGCIVGRAHNNPILDTRLYDVEFPDGHVSEYTANVIAENMYAQCDAQGNQLLLMNSIVDHQKTDKAVDFADRFIVKQGRKYLRRTTLGWKLCIQWKDGTTSWEKLSDMKESYPVEVAEYAVAHELEHEPAFAWWSPYVLKKRNRIISAVKKRFIKRTHKFGLEIPKSVLDAQRIDKENGNTLWQDAIAKEMKNVRIAFKILEDQGEVPIGHQYMDCHIIFDIKLDGFVRKARMVAGGHMISTPPNLTYSSVVSRETVRIALTMAALHDLDVATSDVQNAFLTAPCDEKVWTILGPEFGVDAGRPALIVRALYGLGSASASFSKHLADCMRHMDYEPCRADGDLWYKSMIRPDDGFEYYAYILLYVDDCLCIHHDPKGELTRLDKYFMMKPGSIADPDMYLGAKLRKIQLANGVWSWSQSASKYVQQAVNNFETCLVKHKYCRKLPKRASGPWLRDYRPELDESKELNHDMASEYQTQIGVLHWIVELGRIDIITEVSTLASYMANPREGHFDALLHVFAYLRDKHNARSVLDPTYPEINWSEFNDNHDWKRFYGDIHEAIPPNAPPPRGKVVDLRMFVDSDHAGDSKTRRSRSGLFIFLNSALIHSLSKRQPTVETSVFGAEFVAMKTGIEILRGIRYKLRMMGIPISGPTLIYGDNMSVINNTTKPESTLKKKSNQICFHACRESVAMNESLMSHVKTDENLADLATKLIPAGAKREYLVSKLLRDIYD